MFSIFKKKTLVTNIEWLGVDMHSHLLPGIDDGSPDVEQSVKLIKGLNELGFSKFICTPHIFKELYPNTNETIFLALEATKVALRKANVSVEIAAAAEHMIDENFEVKEGLMVLPGSYILVEMSYLNEAPNIEKFIFDLQIKGYKVILAHPERYNFYHQEYRRFHRYKDMGVLFQLNLLSVTGYYGREVKRTAEYLLEKKCYDLAGTDLHHFKHMEALKKCVQNGYLYNKIGSYRFLNKQLFPI
ncbi:tyrosine-protein phosphatase [Pedobacter sp. JCM 36344]|uniref:tyrosine-protein phosphatase n=1 Tax=Pedobacter sp. JCM 36344 TaxID=3374280 RepID=UPI003978FE59